MRLLMTTDTVGGVWTFTAELTAELLRRGHAIALVSFGPAPSAEHEAWISPLQSRYGNAFSFTAADVPLEWSQDNEQAFSAGEPVLARVAEVFNPDLLVCNQFCFGASTLLLPRVVIAHSDVLSWARAAKPSALDPTPWLNRYTTLVQGGLLQANALVAPTRAAIEGLRPNFFLPDGGMVIPNGRRLPAPEIPASRKLQAITAGRLWDEAKGLDTLLAADLPLPVLIAGQRHMENKAAPATPANVQLLGALPSDQLQELFRQSAIYLCTSVYEPFGLAPLEAALCGCAIVARDLPSLREVWGGDALYFRDAAELTRQVQRLVAEPELLAEAQRRAHGRAGLYTVERMTDAYVAVFDAVFARAGAVPHVA